MLKREAFASAGRGDTAGVLAMLNGGVGIDTVNEYGYTLLSTAAQHDHTGTLRALAAAGADVNAADNKGQTPILIAAALGFTDTVRALLECGADPCICNNDGKTPLVVAASLDRMAVVRVLLQGGVDVNACNRDGWSAVMAAALQGGTETLRMLVKEFGAVLTNENPRGFTPVYVAALAGNTEMVRALVCELGADANIPTSRGSYAVNVAANAGDPELAWTLVREGGAMLDLPRQDLARQQRLAFAMASHPRLGRSSRASALCDHLLQMVLREHVASGPRASEVAESGGHQRLARMLEFLENEEGKAPVHAVENAARRAAFQCPVCLEPGEARALVPCAHLVCRTCWANIQRHDERCPTCRDGDAHAVDPETFPDSARLYG